VPPALGQCKVKRVEHLGQCMRVLKGKDEPTKDKAKGNNDKSKDDKGGKKK